MGQGYFDGSKFHFKVVANYAMTPADWTEWRNTWNQGSKLLYNATNGQVQFGTLMVSDDSQGIANADVILFSAGDPSTATSGGFGKLGEQMHIMPYVKTQTLSIVHEWGHHAWNLKEEYSAPLLTSTMDTSAGAPNTTTIPIVDAGLANNELSDADADALLSFGGVWERRAVVSNTATTVTVSPGFSDLPTNADYTTVYYQTPAECPAPAVANPSYCIMQFSRSSAGTFNASTNVWTPAANPVTEFCTPDNHDPDGDTMQQDTHGESCWETIVGTDGYTALTAPVAGDGDSPTAMPGGHVDIDWIQLASEARYALVIDRSGSMGDSHKMEDAQYGAIYWLEFSAVADDNVAIIWYNTGINTLLPLTQVSAIPDLEVVKNDINALTPTGGTNIRDGLAEALNQVAPSGNPEAAIQTVILLSDGQHNRPVGTSALEVVDSYKQAGAQIHALGVGQVDEVDMDTLDELALQTDGTSSFVGDDDEAQIETALVEINADVRGGMLESDALDFPAKEKDPLGNQDDREEKRPDLRELMKIWGLQTPKDLLADNPKTKHLFQAVPVYVEKNCPRASFSIVFKDSADFWMYLIDPDTNPVDMNGPGITHVKSKAPHEFAIVKGPKGGMWHIIMVRRGTGGATRGYAVAGGENPKIQIFGGVTQSVIKDHEKVELWGAGKYVQYLRGLRVTVELTGPGGITQRVELKESDNIMENDGRFTAAFTPQEQGRWKGVITVSNRGKAEQAKVEHLLLKSQKDTIDLRLDVPRFTRKKTFYFDYGNRPKIRPQERDEKGEEPGGGTTEPPKGCNPFGTLFQKKPSKEVTGTTSKTGVRK